MLTPDQQLWIDHLSDESKIEILPHDPTCHEKFEKIKNLVIKEIGSEVQFEHRGASSMGISGQDEIDTYIPVDIDSFDEYISRLTQLFGESRKIYPNDRAHFIAREGGKRIDIYLINKEAPSWLNCVKFENYLKSNPNALEEYRILKEEGNGLSTREYYRRKVEFINEILSLAN